MSDIIVSYTELNDRLNRFGITNCVHEISHNGSFIVFARDGIEHKIPLQNALSDADLRESLRRLFTPSVAELQSQLEYHRAMVTFLEQKSAESENE